MKQTIVTPVHIKINGKFILTADKVEIYHELDTDNMSAEKKMGQTINIVKKGKLSEEEESKSNTDKAKHKEYDEWFEKMRNDRNSHIPITS